MRLVAMSRVIIEVTVPRLSQEGLESTEANSGNLNPATVWHHPKNGQYELQRREIVSGGV